MGKPLSTDLRSRLVAAVAGGMSRRAAAKRFGVAPASAVRWVHASTTTGTIAPKPQGGDKRSGRIEASATRSWPRSRRRKTSPWSSWPSCCARGTARRSRPARSGAFSTATRSPLKKTAHAAEQERSDVAARRKTWSETQPDLDPARLVFIDETGASTKMARLRGRAGRGQRCRAAIPHGHWKTTTFTGALRVGGMTAPMVLDGR